MTNLAIITARGGSKRIPRKNIKEFMAKPMIAYAIEASLESGIFDEVMVSTDDMEIAQISQHYGAKVPFMRSAESSNDFATTADVLGEVLEEYKKLGRTFDKYACIYPCVPFLTGQILRDAFKKFEESGFSALTPVVKFSFPIQRALKINNDGFLEYREPENALKRSQDLENMYHDAGMFYFYNLNPAKVGVIPYIMDESVVQDIDNESDWKLAEIKYRVLYGV